MHKNSEEIETILAELMAGIIPTSIFLKNLEQGINSFEGMEEKEARRLKRKWRKLKKKLGVKNTNIASASFVIRRFLRSKAEKEIFDDQQ